VQKYVDGSHYEQWSHLRAVAYPASPIHHCTWITPADSSSMQKSAKILRGRKDNLAPVVSTLWGPAPRRSLHSDAFGSRPNFLWSFSDSLFEAICWDCCHCFLLFYNRVSDLDLSAGNGRRVDVTRDNKHVAIPPVAAALCKSWYSSLSRHHVNVYIYICKHKHRVLHKNVSTYISYIRS